MTIKLIKKAADHAELLLEGRLDTMTFHASCPLLLLPTPLLHILRDKPTTAEYPAIPYP